MAIPAFGSINVVTMALDTPNGTLRTRASIVRQAGRAVADPRDLSVDVSDVFGKTCRARIDSAGRGKYHGSPRTVFATPRLNYP